MNAFFTQLLATIKTAEGQALIPDLITFLQYANANKANWPAILLQADVLRTQIVAAQPNILMAELSSLDGALITELQTELAKFTTPAAPPVTK